MGYVDGGTVYRKAARLEGRVAELEGVLRLIVTVLGPQVAVCCYCGECVLDHRMVLDAVRSALGEDAQ